MAALFCILAAIGAIWSFILCIAVAIGDRKFPGRELLGFAVLAVCAIGFAGFI